MERFNLEDILSLIEQEKYFVLHAPRQMGKTSCMPALMKHLNKSGKYDVRGMRGLGGGVRGWGVNGNECNYINVSAPYFEKILSPVTTGKPLVSAVAMMNRSQGSRWISGSSVARTHISRSRSMTLIR